MNLRVVVKQFGLLLLMLSGVLLALSGLFVAIELLLQHEVSRTAGSALALSGAGGGVVGGLTWWLARNAPPHLGRREALLLVAMTWLLGAAFAALPYFLWALWPDSAVPDGHPFRDFIDCYFESMSGLTTTGATVLGGDFPIESIPRSLLLWRAFTQWVGGLGIVVLFVAVLPSLGMGGARLFRAEVAGPAPEGFQPQIRQTARVLLLIYGVLTLAEMTALLIAGMTFFDAVCHTFTTIATAGFSTRTESIGAYGLGVQLIVIVFMVISAVNFGLYYAMVRGKFRNVWRDPEFRTYVILLAAGSTLITLALLGQPIMATAGEWVLPSPGAAAQYGVFGAVSIGTSTGYCTADTNLWPFLAQAVLILFMFIGGCAGSTAGGIKVIRIWIAFKVMISEIEHVFRPQVVRPVRVGSSIIDNELKLGTLAYVLGIVLMVGLGSVIIMLLEEVNGSGACDFASAATASLACLCTIGPGFAGVGAMEHYGWLSDSSKLVLSLFMALGRLEVFAIIVLFTPRFWRGD